MNRHIPTGNLAYHCGALDFTSRCFRYSPRLLVGLFCLAFVVHIPGLTAQPDQTDPAWVATWATSPSTLPAPLGQGPAYDNQTVRLIVHSSLGGSALRLRLSNAHGDGPLRVGAVTVAIQAEGSRIVPDSQIAITFSGEDAITIPRWATVLSDPVAFEVPGAGNLAVSIYFPQDSGLVTAHALSNQTNYVSGPGNHSAAVDLSVAEPTPAWPLLTAIEVLPERDARTIVTLGDSITDGWGSTDSANERWPDHFARRLYADDSVPDYSVVNAGISGNRVTTEQSPQFGQNLQARLERDVLALNNISHIILLEGINDIGMSARGDNLIDAGEIIAGYRQVIARARARGIQVIGATLLPYEGAVYYTDEGNQVRMEVNDFIRNSGEFDGVIEFDTSVRDPNNPNRIRREFTEDNLHPNDAGYAVMAGMIDLDLFRD